MDPFDIIASKICDDISKFINEQLVKIFEISIIYNVYLFETKYLHEDTFKIISIRIANSNSPRLNYYEGIEYITPPGTPRNDYIEETPRDELCNHIHKNKNDFLDIIISIIEKYYPRYIKDSITLRFHSDRITIKFRNGC